MFLGKDVHVSEKTRTSFFKNKKAVSSLPPDTAFHYLTDQEISNEA